MLPLGQKISAEKVAEILNPQPPIAYGLFELMVNLDLVDLQVFNVCASLSYYFTLLRGITASRLVFCGPLTTGSSCANTSYASDNCSSTDYASRKHASNSSNAAPS